MAFRFASEGASVVVGDVNESTAEEMIGAATAAGLRVQFVRTDVADEASVEAMVASAVRGFGRLDCLVNNAAIGGAFGPVTQMHVADWDTTFAVLVRGVFLGIKH